MQSQWAPIEMSSEPCNTGITYCYGSMLVLISNNFISPVSDLFPFQFRPTLYVADRRMVFGIETPSSVMYKPTEYLLTFMPQHSLHVGPICKCIVGFRFHSSTYHDIVTLSEYFAWHINTGALNTFSRNGM